MKKILFTFILAASFMTHSCISDNEDPVSVSPVEGAIADPAVGGAAQPNQVWIDLSDADSQGKPRQTVTRRTDWDLALYSGNEFKVVLNSSIMMAAGKIPNATDIDAVTETSVSALKNQVQVANFNPSNVAYIDDVAGNFPSGYTAIEGIKANDSENAVYLVNMGKDIYSGTVPTGSVTTGGDERGWMKIQMVRWGTGYKVKYAALNETTHKELIISKNPAYNYNFISLKNNKELFIQPEKKKWDIAFTVFTNTIAGAGSYIYADFVTLNNVGGASAYEVVVPSPASGTEVYNNFKASDIVPSKLMSNDQRIIGSNWRNPVGTNGLEVYGDRFYVLKDAEGYFFKLRFTRLTSTSGERGFPQFEYKPL